MLTGAVRPDAGRVTLDGRRLSAYPAEELPRAIGGLLAEAYVFHATVRENLLLGRPGAGEDGAGRRDRAPPACSTGYATSRTAGTPWSARRAGSSPAASGSGSRWPGRCSPRRPVLVLDEPTEGLDPAAADAVLASALAATPAGHSVLLISHRLSGLAELDEIVVLDAGRVVQRGRHAELVAGPGWYREQWLLQEAAERGYLALTP